MHTRTRSRGPWRIYSRSDKHMHKQAIRPSSVAEVQRMHRERARRSAQHESDRARAQQDRTGSGMAIVGDVKRWSQCRCMLQQTQRARSERCMLQRNSTAPGVPPTRWLTGIVLARCWVAALHLPTARDARSSCDMGEPGEMAHAGARGHTPVPRTQSGHDRSTSFYEALRGRRALVDRRQDRRQSWGCEGAVACIRR